VAAAAAARGADAPGVIVVFFLLDDDGGGGAFLAVAGVFGFVLPAALMTSSIQEKTSGQRE